MAGRTKILRSNFALVSPAPGYCRVRPDAVGELVPIVLWQCARTSVMVKLLLLRAGRDTDRDQVRFGVLIGDLDGGDIAPDPALRLQGSGLPIGVRVMLALTFIFS